MRRPIALAAVLTLLASTAAAAQTDRVAVTEVRQKPWVQTLPLSGTLTSPRDADLAPQIAGLVAAVHVDAGDRVEAGDTLIELDRALEELTLRQLRAQIEEARGQLAEAERVRDERAPLARQGTIARTELEAAQAEVRIRRAAVQRLQAEAERQAERLRRHSLTAPFSGVIRARHTEVGEWADTSATVLELVATDPLRLDVQAPQEYFGRIALGTDVTVIPDADPDARIEAEVSVDVAAADPVARTFLVRIRVDNPDGRLAPGMSAQARFRIATGERVAAVPRDALLRYPDGGTRVWVVAEGDDGPVVHERRVKVGRTDAGVAEIREGVAAGDRVVVRGNESLREGQRVDVIEPGG
ncbi:RND family efflux transporter MFP subunit [Salinisphaera sp. PC39]|uniref:efflux RND transporter periplasmic adaptor subunit n=1 Tax=Salinisphaera sp. PC39 TaxID=1304156 RepID=UPI00333F8C16